MYTVSLGVCCFFSMIGIKGALSICVIGKQKLQGVVFLYIMMRTCGGSCVCHDDVIKWIHFPRYWPFVWGIHRPPVNSPHKGLWRGALMFPLICVWINDWANNREVVNFRRHRGHCDVIVMCCVYSSSSFVCACVFWLHAISFNSLLPGRSVCDFKNAICNLVLLIVIFISPYHHAIRWMPLDLSDVKST